MSRQFKPEDLQAIHRIRKSIEESEQLSTCYSIHQADSSFDQHPDNSIVFLQTHPITSIAISRAQKASSLTHKEHFVYVVEVKTRAMEWEISRRYSEFHNLHETVKKHTKMTADFPKKVFNPFLPSTHPTVVEQRTIKLNIFIKEVAEIVKQAKHPFLSYSFVNFIQMQQNFDEVRWGQIARSTSADAYSSPLASLKTYSQGTIGLGGPSSVEGHLQHINDPINIRQSLAAFDSFLKERKGKLSIEEIRLTVVGAGKLKGLLDTGLSHPNELKRMKALSILAQQINPQKNYFWQKWTKVIERIEVEEWVVDNMSHFDCPGFKLLYFELMRTMYLWVCKENHEKTLLKTLFSFHVQLQQDFLKWLELKTGKDGPPSPTTAIRRQQKRLTEKEKEGFRLLKGGAENFYTKKEGNAELHVNNERNSIVIYLECSMGIEEKQQRSVDWSSLVEFCHKDDYIDLTRAMINIGKLKYHLRCIPVPVTQHDKINIILNRALPYSLQRQSESEPESWVVKQQCSVGIQPEYTEYIQMAGTCLTIIVMVGQEILQQCNGIVTLADLLFSDAIRTFQPKQ